MTQEQSQSDASELVRLQSELAAVNRRLDYALLQNAHLTADAARREAALINAVSGLSYAAGYIKTATGEAHPYVEKCLAETQAALAPARTEAGKSNG